MIVRIFVTAFLIFISAKVAVAHEVVIAYCDSRTGSIGTGVDRDNYFGLGQGGVFAGQDDEAAATAIQNCIAKGGNAECCQIVGSTSDPTIFADKKNCISLAIGKGKACTKLFPQDKCVEFGTGYGKKTNEADAGAIEQCISKGGENCVVRVGACRR